MISYQPFFKDPWSLIDSEAYLDCFRLREDVPEGLHLLIVVIHNKVMTVARNAGFSATSKIRVLPLSISDIETVDISPEARKRAPKIVDADVVMRTMGYKTIADLEELLPLSIADPAVLWDLDILIGSLVHMPESHSSFRIISSSKEPL